MDRATQTAPDARTRAPAAIPKGAWGVAALLFFYMVINFADKVVVGLAGAPLMADLKLTPERFGLLGSAFFWLFSASALLVGLLADRFPARWILLALALVWALTQFPIAVEGTGFWTLLVCRVILGAGEGPAFSVAVHALYKWFPDEKRALPTAVLSQGSAMGVVLAVPALNHLIVHYSWRWAFAALGIVGLVWIVLWLFLGREGPLREAPAPGEPKRYPWRRLATTRTFIGAAVATFGAYWTLTTALTWFTPFLVTGLGYSQADAGKLTVLPWLAGGAAVLASGFASQRMMARGAGSRRARAVLGAAPLILCGLLLAALGWAPTPGAAVLLLVLAAASAGPIYPLCPPMIGEIAPAAQRGAMLAAYGALYTLAGVAAPAVMGGIVQNAATPLQGYVEAFAINGVLTAACGFVGLLLMNAPRDRARLAGHTMA